MPYSDSAFDDMIRRHLEAWSYQYYLDIGPGAGKFGLFVRQLFPNAYLEAIEIDCLHVANFELRNIYDAIRIGPAVDIVDSHPDYHTECVIIGDCIEHMKKSEGIDLLHYLLYRCKKIIVVFPKMYVQYSWNGHPAEAHRSSWGRRDFKGMKHRWHKKGSMRLVVIDGYLAAPETTIPSEVRELLSNHISIMSPAKLSSGPA